MDHENCKLEDTIYLALCTLLPGERLKFSKGVVTRPLQQMDDYLWLTCSEGIKPTTARQAALFLAGVIKWDEIKMC
jgi:hypothetical protein